MTVRNEALLLSYAIVETTELDAFVVLCQKLQDLYAKPTLLGFHDEFQLTETLNACIYNFMMKHEPAILVNFIKDRPLEDMTVPAVYGELLKLSQIAMVRSEAFISRPLRDETHSILSTFTGLGQDLSRGTSQLGMHPSDYIDNPNGLDYLGLGREQILNSPAYMTRPPFMPTISTLEATFSYPELGRQLLSNCDLPHSVSRSITDYVGLAPPNDSLDTGYGSSGQLNMTNSSFYGSVDLNMSSSTGFSQGQGQSQELTWFSKGPADMSSLYEENSYNGQTPRRSSALGASSASIQQSLESGLDTLLAEFQPGATGSGSESTNVTPQNTPKRAKATRTAPAKARRDTPKRATSKRRADKENTGTA